MNKQLINPNTKEKGMSYRGRLFARLGFIVACIFLCPSLICASISLTPSAKTGNFWDDTFPIILTLSILFSAVFSIIKFRPSWRAPINVMPSYNLITPDKLGEIFEVWFQETIQGFPFGNGTIVFQEKEVILEGYLFRGTLYSLLSQLQGEKVSGKILYADVTSVAVKERLITFAVKTNLTLMPQAKLSFYISEIDEERMLRELKEHFPTQF